MWLGFVGWIIFSLIRQPNAAFQPRRLMIASAADGCKRLLGGEENRNTTLIERELLFHNVAGLTRALGLMRRDNAHK